MMHRLAVRLGIRDGQAYTVVTGVVLALVLGVVGLPGVLRGVDLPLAAPVAASPTDAAVSPSGLDDLDDQDVDGLDTATGAAPVAGALPALNAPTGPLDLADPTGSDPTPPPTTEPPAATPDATAGPVLRASLDRTDPVDVALGPDGTLWVATDDGAAAPDRGRLLAVAPDGAVSATYTAPAAPVTATRGLSGVTVDRAGTVWVADAGTASVARLRGDALEPAATVPDVPACGLLGRSGPCEPGLFDSRPVIESVSADGDSLLVADRGQGAVWRIAGGKVSLAATVADRIPGEGPVAAAALPDGSIVVAVSARAASLPPGAPALLRIRRGEAAPEVVLELQPGEVPGDVAVAESGRVYLTIPSARVVADVGLEQGDRVDVDRRGIDPPLTAPTGLALGDRTLFVTDPGALTDLRRPGVVHALPVPDRPLATPAP